VYKLLTILSFMLVGNISFGLDINVSNAQDTIYVNLSFKDPNVISVDNDRIQKYVTRKGVIAGSLDARTGALTMQPQDINKKVFSLVIFTEKGKRYTLLSQVKDIPSQDLVIKAKNTDIQIKPDEKNSYKTDKLSDLLVAMKSDYIPFGYKLKEYNGNPNFIKSHLKKNKDVLIKSYMGNDFVGEVIEFKNILKNNTKLHEKEFISKGVLAVSIDKSTLKPNEITKIYRVIKNG
tara:strand:+ start:5989 stop:6690 length:702 start_codon:yes stop_codon:yes gene_type:complete